MLETAQKYGDETAKYKLSTKKSSGSTVSNFTRRKRTRKTRRRPTGRRTRINTYIHRINRMISSTASTKNFKS